MTLKSTCSNFFAYVYDVLIKICEAKFAFFLCYKISQKLRQKIDVIAVTNAESLKHLRVVAFVGNRQLYEFLIQLIGVDRFSERAIHTVVEKGLKIIFGVVGGESENGSAFVRG